MTRTRLAAFNVFAISSALAAAGLASISDLRSLTAAAGLAAGALGLALFFRHGGRIITTAGVYGIAVTVFVGYPAVYFAIVEPERVSLMLLAAIAASCLTLIMQDRLFWRGTNRELRKIQVENVVVDRSAVTAVTLIGSALAIGGVAANRLGLSVGPIAASMTYVGAVLVAVATLTRTRGSRRRVSVVRVAVALGVLLAYVDVQFTGGGRLIVATLALALLVGGQALFPRVPVKALAVASIIPALVYFGSVRAPERSRVEGTAAAAGLGSVVSPLLTFAEVLERQSHGELGYGWGSTFVATAGWFVPRSVWSSKPVGFGAELTKELRPDLVRVGHSMAALNDGEWVYNFGPAGLLLMVLPIGLLVRYSDQRLADSLATPSSTAARLMYLGLTAILCVGIADLVWVGSFTYMARTGTRLIIGLSVLVVLSPGTAYGFVRGGGGSGAPRASDSLEKHFSANAVPGPQSGA